MRIDFLKKTGLLSLAVFAALSVNSATLMAQDVATGSVTATVVTPLTVTATSPLAFGIVYQGVPKSVGKNSADAAVFDIAGQANADLLLYLSLPEYLGTASGDDRMTVVFPDNVCDIDTGLVAQPGDPTSFASGWQGEDPHNLMGVAGGTPSLGDAGFCAIYIGGRVIPTLDQTAGSYTADIILTVAYDGT